MRRYPENGSLQQSDALIAVHHFFYVSNLLSVMRIALIPFIFWSIMHRRHLATAALGGLAILSDALDGFFARRLNQHSNLGKVLDPIADKIAIASVILALVLSGRDVPRWAFGIVIARDVLIVLASIVLFRKTQIIARSNLWGKCTTVVLSAALILYILEDVIAVPAFFPFYVLCIGLILGVISIWSYGRRLFNLLRASELQRQK
jgi:CDP-diacylglycerol--glycerol-3-phosphate 3-phosphatidyltransferase